ncbi:MAG: ATP-binding protein [Candidatus Delongbacteria bacterium]|nr:ATP-binding protein [Candidatus Delongbacteria bacterium]
MIHSTVSSSVNINKVYSKKLIKSFFGLFFIFSIIIVLILFHREKNKNIEVVEGKLSIYNEVITNYLIHNDNSDITKYKELDSLCEKYFDHDLRITIIEENGKVLYDNRVNDLLLMDDHSNRNEILSAEFSSEGTDVRLSKSTDVEYFYYAKKLNNLYIRTALPVNADLKDILRVDYVFIVFLFMIFFIMSFLLIYVSDHFGRSIKLLRKFSVAMATGSDISDDIEFTNNELGEISNQIKKVYLNFKSVQNKLNLEKEKFIQHLSISNEGIGIFSNDSTLLLYNNNFINFINKLSDGKLEDNLKEYSRCININDFVKATNNYIHSEYKINDNSFHSLIKRNDQYFDFHFLLFKDKSFEIIINDITEPENRKLIKQQISSNISHELKTPVAAISGFLETLLNNDNIQKEKIMEFIGRSYKQVKRLSILIDDISTLNRIDEANKLYLKEKLRLDTLINEIISDLDMNLKSNNMEVSVIGFNSTYINGNYHLLDAIFRNLLDNSIKYAGKDTKIKIERYFEDNEFISIKFSDNGKGIPEEHLHRIFERFYRIDKGRSRVLGGTGLGLAIVKNAVHFHNGEIFVKSLNKGIEFSFSLKK